jgi:phosphomannomutase
MALLLLEILGAYQAPLHEIIADLQAHFGPTVYQREDIHLSQPVAKAEMVKRLADKAPASMGGQTLKEIQTTDGIKFFLADDSWLLIRPSGTEPVLRVYAEGTSAGLVGEMLAAGKQMAAAD